MPPRRLNAEPGGESQQYSAPRRKSKRNVLVATKSADRIVVDPHLLGHLTRGVLAHVHRPTPVQINPHELLPVVI